MATQIIMPRLGASVSEVAVTRWLVQEGDPVEAFQPILEVETSMVGSEIPSPASGVLLKIMTPAGQQARSGDLLAWIGQPGEEIPEDPPPLNWEPQFQLETDAVQPHEADTIALRSAGMADPDENRTQAEVPSSEDNEVGVSAPDEGRAPSQAENTELIDWVGDAAAALPDNAELTDWFSGLVPMNIKESGADQQNVEDASTSPGEDDESGWVGEVPPAEYDFEFNDPNETLPVNASKVSTGHRDDTPPLGIRAVPAEPEAASPPDEEQTNDQDDQDPQNNLANFISPAVSRLAERHAVDLSLVTGTGEGGRITKQDVERYIEARSFQETLAGVKHNPGQAAAPDTADEAAHTPGISDQVSVSPREEDAPPQQRELQIENETDPYGETAGAAGWQQEVTLTLCADVARTAEHLAANRGNFSRDGTRLTYTTYFVTAAIAALKAVPGANFRRTVGGGSLPEEFNIGLVVALDDDGFVTPIIQNANGLSLLGMARAINELAQSARERNLQPGKTGDAALAVVNYGATGVRLASPLIFPPARLVLGCGLVEKRPQVVADAIAIRPVVDLTLTFDPETINALTANRFLTQVAAALETWE